MKLHHIAIWTFRLEELKDFYVRFLGGTSNEKYINPKKGFESYFVSFGEGPSLELMSRTDVQNTPIEENRLGLTHLAFTFPNREEVLRFTEQMRSEGYPIAVQSPNQKIPDRKTKCVIKTHINIKQNVIFGAKLKPV